MTAAQSIMVAILLQQGLLGAAWAAAGAVGLRRSATWTWACSGWLLALACVLLLLRPSLGPWFGTLAPNLAALLAFMAVRRGILTYAQAPLKDREQLVVFGLAALGMALAVPAPGPTAVASTLSTCRCFRGRQPPTPRPPTDSPRR
jgi:hypothetical protein